MILETKAGIRHCKQKPFLNVVEFVCSVVKGTEYFVLFSTRVVTTEDYYVTFNSEELIGTTKYLTL